MAFLQEYKGVHGYEVLDVAVASDNSNFVSCGGDRTVFHWDVSTGRIIRRFQVSGPSPRATCPCVPTPRWQGHTHRVNTAKFSKDDQVVVSGSYDATIKVWDTRSNMRDPIQTLAEFKDSVTSVLATESEILAASVDGTVKTFDIRMGRMTTDHVARAMTSLRLSNDGNCVLLSCLDNSIRLLDKGTGGLLGEYKGHQHNSYSIESCFTNTDAHVVSGSEDSKIYFWDLVEAKVVHTLAGHSKPVVSLDFHPDRICMVSASSDGTAKCWV